MIAVSYKKKGNNTGVVYLPQSSLRFAKEKANKLHQQGYVNIRVVVMDERVIYIPEIGDLEYGN